MLPSSSAEGAVAKPAIRVVDLDSEADIAAPSVIFDVERHVGRRRECVRERTRRSREQMERDTGSREERQAGKYKSQLGHLAIGC